MIDIGIEKIIIGTGYHNECYEKFANNYSQVVCIKNDWFKETGSMYTLYNLREKVQDDFLLLESDLIYEKRGLMILMEHNKEDVILSSGKTKSNDEVFIEINEEGNLVNMSKISSDLKSVHSELIGISKISYLTFQKMCRFAKKEFVKNMMLDYEYSLVGVSKNTDIFIEKIEEFIWGEIDNEDHLYRAKNFIYPKLKELELQELKSIEISYRS